MPTVIALDVSLSMRRPILGSGSGENNQIEQLTRHHLAVHGINALLHYLQANSKLEFVALVSPLSIINSSLLLVLLVRFHFNLGCVFLVVRSYLPIHS